MIIEQPQKREKNQYREVVLINPKNPDFIDVAIGVEITLPGFSGLNLDHHGQGYTSDFPLAIEQALSLDISFLPEGKIATVRPDPDSIGAIAVILLRIAGEHPYEKVVKAIVLADRKGPGFFEEKGAEILGLTEEKFEKYKKIVAVARYKIVSQRLPLEEAVIFMKKILTGKISDQEIEEIYQKD